MSRVVAEEALGSPRRGKLFAAIQANPGIAFRELSRLTGLAPGTARHHLTVLCRGGFIVERSHGVTLRFFDTAVDHDQAWIEVVLRREPALAALHDWLKANPRASQDQVVESMAVYGWPRSTTQHRLARLVQAGLATLALRGRYKIYSAATERSLSALLSLASVAPGFMAGHLAHRTRRGGSFHSPVSSEPCAEAAIAAERTGGG